MINKEEIDVLLLKALVKSNHSMHIIDLDEDSFVEYTATDYVHNNYSNTITASQMIRTTIATFSVPELKEEAYRFTDLTTLKERFKESPIVSSDFIGNQAGWIRATFMPLSHGEDGLVKLVCFTTRVINSEKMKEQMLLKMSNTDEMTMLANRRAFEAFLEQYRDQKDLGDFTIVSLDVNGLKLINDTLGHMAGDELIRLSADAIRTILCRYGEAFRTGGDEFIAAIHMEPERIAKLKREFNRYVSTLSGNYVDKISISFGAASAVKNTNLTIEELWKTADVEMYKDKERYYRKMRLQRRVDGSKQ